MTSENYHETITFYISKNGNDNNIGTDSAHPILTINKALHLALKRTPCKQNSWVTFCFGEGEWEDINMSSLPFRLQIKPYNNSIPTEFSTTLPQFNQINIHSSMVYLCGVVAKDIHVDRGYIEISGYNKTRHIRTDYNGHVRLSTCKIEFYNDSNSSVEGCFIVGTNSSLYVHQSAEILVSSNYTLTYGFLRLFYGGQSVFLNSKPITVNSDVTVTGRKYYIDNGSSSINNKSTLDDLPGSQDGFIASNGITNLVPWGGGDTTKYLRADGTWDKNGLVHTTGNENIDGIKTFRSNIYLQHKEPRFVIKNNNYSIFDQSTDREKPSLAAVNFNDKDDKFYATVSAGTTYNKPFISLQSMFIDNENPDNNIASAITAITDPSFPTIYTTIAGNIQPTANNAYTVGTATYLWKQVYAGTTTISTSDARLKENVNNYSDEFLDIWGKLQFRNFLFKDSVLEKGTDKARIHSGLIAQEIKSVFESNGLNPSKYAFFCHDEWEASPKIVDDNNVVLKDAVEAGDRYSLRYEELLCIEAAYQRRRADKLEARIAALEAKVN